jgi:AcrR family transcriptional regulator
MTERRSLPTQLREQRVEAVLNEVERVALLLFDEHGFDNVTVESIAAEAGISDRTFYRYFPSKEDVFLLRTRRGAEQMRAALAEQPLSDPPLHSVRVVAEKFAGEDPEYVGRWVRAVASTPSVLAVVLGGIQLIFQPVIREFFATRFGLPEDSLPVWVWASAVESAIQTAQIRWHLVGGDLSEITSTCLKTLEEGISVSMSAGVDGSYRKGQR